MKVKQAVTSLVMFEDILCVTTYEVDSDSRTVGGESTDFLSVTDPQLQDASINFEIYTVINFCGC